MRIKTPNPLISFQSELRSIKVLKRLLVQAWLISKKPEQKWTPNWTYPSGAIAIFKGWWFLSLWNTEIMSSYLPRESTPYHNYTIKLGDAASKFRSIVSLKWLGEYIQSRQYHVAKLVPLLNGVRFTTFQVKGQWLDSIFGGELRWVALRGKWRNLYNVILRLTWRNHAWRTNFSWVLSRSLSSISFYTNHVGNISQNPLSRQDSYKSIKRSRRYLWVSFMSKFRAIF